MPGRLNTMADVLSRNNMKMFFSQASEAARTPTEAPSQLVDLLVTAHPDWTSPAWSRLFTSRLQRDWLLPPKELTSPERKSTPGSVLGPADHPSH